MSNTDRARRIAAYVETPAGAASSGLQRVERSIVSKRIAATVGPAMILRDGEPALAATLVGGSVERGLEWQIDGTAPAGPITIALFGPVGRFLIEVESDGGTGSFTSSFPTQVTTSRYRREPRIVAPENVSIAWRSGVGTVVAALRSFSEHGLSCDARAEGQRLCVGDTVDAEVSWRGEFTVRLRMTIRRSTKTSDGYALGANVVFREREGQRLWQGQIDAIRHPYTRVGLALPGPIWDLFEKAGYFALSDKQPQDFARYRLEFDSVCETMAASETPGAQIVFPSSRGLESSISALVTFPETASLYHMARRPGADPRGISAKTVLRASYEHAISWIARSGVEWVSVWVQDITRFACGTHRDFAAAHADPKRACVLSFHALEIAARPRASFVPPTQTWEVRLARESELPGVLRKFEEQYPAPLPVARAWSVSYLGVSKKQWLCAPRDRAVVVAVQAGDIKAAAILESTPLGTHLFGIFDTMHLARFERGDAATQPLLQFASDWYARRGKDHFVYASNEPARDVAGARDLGLTHDTIISSELLPEFLEHIWLMTA